jgi:poly-gamma-glutamate synthase PgsB/CapB
MIVVSVLVIIVLAALVAETVVLRRRLRRIPLRIHVNGTRGKSSVVRYIAAGLRAGGRRPFAKITGVHPTMILPDGEGRRISRRGTARVQEQVSMVRMAASCRADVLVLECMSILPEYQRLEGRILSPHISVITNIRNDHLEEMGRTVEEQAESICESVPMDAVVVTAEMDNLELIRARARTQRARVLVVGKDHVPPEFAVSQAIPINIALALTVCEWSGVSREAALDGIRKELKAEQEASAIIEVNGRDVRFLNGFAVNDAPSAESFLEHWEDRVGDLGPLMIVLNTRSDRPLRTRSLARSLAEMKRVSSVALIGTHVPVARRALTGRGFSGEQIHSFTAADIRDPFKAFSRILRDERTIVGLGNIAGDGFEMLESLSLGEHRDH